MDVDKVRARLEALKQGNHIQKERAQPKLSLNKLGEYIQASPTRRKSILVEQKFPNKGGMNARYTNAETVIKSAICNPESASEILDDGIVSLLNSTTLNPTDEDLGSLSLRP